MTKHKKKQKVKNEKGSKQPVKKEDQDAEEKLDFIGLPSRDLKKNLGCG